MKKCTWCGKEYPNDAVQCAIDGSALEGDEPSPGAFPPLATEPAHEPAAEKVGLSFQPRVLDLENVPGAFVKAEGFFRPDWDKIRQAIAHNVPTENRDVAWTEAAIQWTERLRSDLGGKYRVRRSRRFILLAELDSSGADELLRFAEEMLDTIQAALGEAAWRAGLGPHVILLFTDDDDYYQYVAYFSREGVHPVSSGCLIHSGYVHIAMPCLDGRHIRWALTHELTHNCVVHLQLPLWLNEGLAVTFARTAAAWHSPILDHELRDRHLAFWTPDEIQKFWSGVSFQEPGDSNELSYSLAEILVKLLMTDPRQFGAFVQNASWVDAGQTAALDCLSRDLGEAVGTFLGQGNWRPNRKAMVESWDAA